MINETTNTFYLEDENHETFHELCRQLADLMNSSSSDFEDLCQSSLVNIWANRPFRYNAFNFGYDPKNPSVAKNAMREARKSVGAGIVPYNLTTSEKNTLWIKNSGLVSFPDVFSIPNRGWTAELPRGSAFNEPNRMRDFDNYRPSASPTLSPIDYAYGALGSNYLDFVSGTATIDMFLMDEAAKRLTVTSPSAIDTYRLDFDAIEARVGHLYAGMLVSGVADLGGVTVYQKTEMTGEKLSDERRFNFVWDLRDVRTGTYRVLPVLWGDSDNDKDVADRELYLLPEVPMRTVRIIQSELGFGIIVGVGSVVSGNIYRFTFDITIHNPSTQNGILVSNNYMIVGVGNEIYEQRISLPDYISLAPNNPAQISVQGDFNMLASPITLPVLISISDGKYTYEGSVTLRKSILD